MSITGSSAKTNVYLVTLSYGDPTTYRRLTNANAPEDALEGRFFSNPVMEIDLPVNSIIDFDDEAQITFDTEGWLFGLQMSSGRAFPPVTTKIQEKLYTDGEDTTILRHVGKVRSVIRNPNGRTGLLRILTRGDKSRLETSLGFSANSTCGANEFGSPKTCGKDLVPLIETGPLTILDNSSRSVRITGLTGTDWTYGKVVYNGHAILIRHFDGDTTFFLA